VRAAKCDAKFQPDSAQTGSLGSLSIFGLLHVLVQHIPEALPTGLRDQDCVSEIPLHLEVEDDDQIYRY
jgi:hypothetical protein